MLTGAIIGAFIGLLVWLLGFVMAGSSKAAGRPFPSKTHACLTMLPPSEALAAVRSAVRPPYQIDESGTSADTVVLAVAPNFKHYGFFIPVRATLHPQGSTQVEVGCMSRSFLPAPVPDRQHAEAFEMVRQAVRGA